MCACMHVCVCECVCVCGIETICVSQIRLSEIMGFVGKIVNRQNVKDSLRCVKNQRDEN